MELLLFLKLMVFLGAMMMIVGSILWLGVRGILIGLCELFEAVIIAFLLGVTGGVIVSAYDDQSKRA